MPSLVQIVGGVVNYVLPNGGTYQGGDYVALTSAQYAAIPPGDLGTRVVTGSQLTTDPTPPPSPTQVTSVDTPVGLAQAGAIGTNPLASRADHAHPSSFPDGTQGAPGFRWATEPTSGFYRAGVGDWRAVVQGNVRGSFTANGIESSSGFRLTGASSRIAYTALTAAGTVAFGAKVGAEANDRIQLTAGGYVLVGPGGATAPDTMIRRGSAAVGVAVRNAADSADAPLTASGVGMPGNYQVVTTVGAGTVTAPAWATLARIRMIGGGGGGGGGGTALTTGGVTTQRGGGGGGAGGVVELVLPVVGGTAYTIQVGAGGAGSTGGAINGNAGGVPQGGGGTERTTIIVGGTTYSAMCGSPGASGGANSSSDAGGGLAAAPNINTTTTPGMPGVGGRSGGASFYAPPGIVGGAGGGTATATIGGGAGMAHTTGLGRLPTGGTVPATLANVSGTANGDNGQSASATAYGSGGGGGGGGAPGGTGGAGGAGGQGLFEVWWS